MKSFAIVCLLAWSVTPVGAANVDCRSCHLAVEPANPAPDFSDYFNNVNREHHSTGVLYPRALGANAEYNQPDGLANDVKFFDNNHNGQLDANEVQLFVNSGSVTVECGSCHIEHGATPAPPGMPPPPGGYLRMDNADSALCTTCHKF